MLCCEIQSGEFSWVEHQHLSQSVEYTPTSCWPFWAHVCVHFGDRTFPIAVQLTAADRAWHHHWHALSFMRTWRPRYSAQLMKRYHSAHLRDSLGCNWLMCKVANTKFIYLLTYFLTYFFWNGSFSGVSREIKEGTMFCNSDFLVTYTY